MSGINEGSDIYNDGTGGGGGGIVDQVNAGAGISIDNTDPAQPVVSANLSAGANVALNTLPGNVIEISAAAPGGVVDSIGAGIGINVDDTDPAAPVVSSLGLVVVRPNGDTPESLDTKLTALAGGPVKLTEVTPSAGVYRLEMESNLAAGSNITFDAGPGGTLRINSSGGGPATSDYGYATFEPALARSGLAIPNINNGGAVLSTYVVVPRSFLCRNLSVLIKQTGGGSIILAIYDAAGALIARTAPAAPSNTGIFSRPVAFDGAGSPITEIQLTGGVGYYFALWGNQSANGAQFYAVDAGTTFGPTPWLGWIRDNVASIPASMAPGSESPIRFQILAKT